MSAQTHLTAYSHTLTCDVLICARLVRSKKKHQCFFLDWCTAHKSKSKTKRWDFICLCPLCSALHKQKQTKNTTKPNTKKNWVFINFSLVLPSLFWFSLCVFFLIFLFFYENILNSFGIPKTTKKNTKKKSQTPMWHYTYKKHPIFIFIFV